MCAHILRLLLISSSELFEDHLEKLECVLKILSDKGLGINDETSTFCADGNEYLRYWVSTSGIQPIPKKAEANKNMVSTSNNT
jgi:hypothetical protein